MVSLTAFGAGNTGGGYFIFVRRNSSIGKLTVKFTVKGVCLSDTLSTNPPIFVALVVPTKFVGTIPRHSVGRSTAFYSRSGISILPSLQPRYMPPLWACGGVISFAVVLLQEFSAVFLLRPQPLLLIPALAIRCQCLYLRAGQ